MLARVIAFLPTLGFQEMILLLVLGILLFGRNLPDAGRQLGRTVSKLRRGMQDFRDQLDRDESVKELRDNLRSTRDEVRRAGAVPRALANPGAAVRDYAQRALEAPAADAPVEVPDAVDAEKPVDPEGSGSAPGDDAARGTVRRDDAT
jgi:sec-independent protein translocase protein TatA